MDDGRWTGDDGLGTEDWGQRTGDGGQGTLGTGSGVGCSPSLVPRPSLLVPSPLSNVLCPTSSVQRPTSNAPKCHWKPSSGATHTTSVPCTMRCSMSERRKFQRFQAVLATRRIFFPAKKISELPDLPSGSETFFSSERRVGFTKFMLALENAPGPFQCANRDR